VNTWALHHSLQLVLVLESFIDSLCCCKRNIPTSRAAPPAINVEQDLQGQLAPKVKTEQDGCVLARWNESDSQRGLFLHEFCSSRRACSDIDWAWDQSCCRHFDWTWEEFDRSNKAVSGGLISCPIWSTLKMDR
jgi:hypothetical protein